MAKAPFIKARGKDVAKTIRFIEPEDKVIKDYGKLRQIALVRHGEPDMVKSGRFNRAEASNYLLCYDSVCIIVPEKPFFQVNNKEEIKVFSSPIKRALTTAHYLFGEDKDITVSPVFREFETKIKPGNSKRSWPISFWTTKARLKWMFGKKPDGIESFSQAKKRAAEAADLLDQSSLDNPKILLTSHGFINRYIKKELKKKGWEVVEDTGSDYLGTTILVKVEK
jgi:broad specificity phosphatase PhoE